MSAEDLVRGYQRRTQEYVKAKGITRTQLTESAGYAEGYGVARDAGEAARLFRIAAEAGDAVAQQNLALL